MKIKTVNILISPIENVSSHKNLSVSSKTHENPQNLENPRKLKHIQKRVLILCLHENIL